MSHTPGPWEWWTSNSWRRLRRSERGVSIDVLMPTVCRDGHPDIIVTPDDMALIASAPALFEALRDTLNMLKAAHLQLGMQHDDNKRVIKARTAIAQATTAL